MENKKTKQNEKTLRQMCEEINQKLAETKEKREAFSIAAKQAIDETFLMECASKLFDQLSIFDISTSGIELQREVCIYNCTYGENAKSFKSIISTENFQKVVDKYSPEKLLIKNIKFYCEKIFAIVEIV